MAAHGVQIVLPPLGNPGNLPPGPHPSPQNTPPPHVPLDGTPPPAPIPNPAPFNPANEKYMIIRTGDTRQVRRRKRRHNHRLNLLKRAYNRTMIVDRWMKWILLADAETGKRPPKICPNTWTKVINTRRGTWYNIGDKMGFPWWRGQRYGRGKMREEWCDWHNVLGVLTQEEREAV
ncbi:hypothetical protein BJ508DRAFT_312665 [Ascobolus immersus RN42]|uniref:Uncharacterized protein n=1 Tax=Ascobolus immersus RN42 TaxID=1160509 RepID=A0A3N4HYD3_ASCIM|nr:hypothetical protein BJ508DRAFT_312665 [Ascobolus immersus RN42]